MIDAIRLSLLAHHDKTLVDELLEAYGEAKANFYRGGKRLSAVEGGRFCEAAFRLLEERSTGSFTQLGRQVDAEAVTRQLANTPVGIQPDSVRLHIPRALRVVYDIRNNRDAAHLSDGIDPNLQDATLVVSLLDWVMAEFVRLYHGASADDAQSIVDELVTRQVPAVQDFGEFPKVLRTDLSAGDFVLLLLYHRAPHGASLAELTPWVRPKMRANLKRTLTRLETEKAYVHLDESTYFITTSGRKHVEAERLFEPE